MVEKWRRTAAAVVAACAVAGCDASDPAAADTCGEPLQTEPGELRTVLRADWFDEDASLVAGAALPDGSILVRYDTNPDEAGDADNLAGEKEEPGLAVLRPDGSCEPFDLPEVDGRRVGVDALPVAVDNDRRLYLWDGSADRLVRGEVGDAWETVAATPSQLLRFGPPAVTVGEDGEVFVATDFRISTVSADGALETIAGTGEAYRYNTYGPVELPRPATSDPLPAINGIRALPTGQLLVSTKSSVLTLEDGTLDLLADWKSTAGQDGAFNRDSSLSSLEVLPSGDVLVSDVPGKRLLRLSHGRSTVFLTDESYLHMPSAAASLADGSALVLNQNGGQAIAVYGLPRD